MGVPPVSGDGLVRWETFQLCRGIFTHRFTFERLDHWVRMRSILHFYVATPLG